MKQKPEITDAERLFIAPFMYYKMDAETDAQIEAYEAAEDLLDLPGGVDFSLDCHKRAGEIMTRSGMKRADWSKGIG